MLRPLDQTFVDSQTLDAARRCLNLKAGAIVVAGGTGSGKSSTVYSMISERQRTRPDSNVLMIEDPIEFRLQGVTQVQVNHGIGLSFARVLRATLRQDPDVIVVGETRDEETALLAMEASISGHLMLTSIHANDAGASIQRLETLGCPRPLISQAMSLVLVQRLAPRLCRSCKTMQVPPPTLAQSLISCGLLDSSGRQLPFPGRCDDCGSSGHSGRVAIVESLAFDDAVRGGLMSGDNIGEVLALAKKNGRFRSYEQCATHLMGRQMLGATDALMAVAR